MRPEILFPLFDSPLSLPGVGKRLAPLIERAAGPHLVDLLWHLPINFIDRRARPKVSEAREGAIATLKVTVDRHIPPATKRLPYKVRCFDDTGYLTLVFFHPHVDYLKRVLPEGAPRLVSGPVAFYQDEIQITHPDYIVAPEEADTLPLIEPVYRVTAGLTPKTMGQAVTRALERVPDLAEWQDSTLLKQRGWPSWGEAVRRAHMPQAREDLAPSSPAHQRLAYDELLANQLALALMRVHLRKSGGRSIRASGVLAKTILSHVGYTLTSAQERAFKEITQDMESPTRMMRLLQGDVGAGKTVVALLALCNAIETGAQGALMAPTEILARQHFAYIAPLAEKAGLKVALLTGRHKAAERRAIVQELASGDIQLLIGTHALFQEGVTFSDLALAVVDEQHRFGVHQRLSLQGKGGATDILVMTATPIPRTLTLTVYGDLDVSRLDEKPPGRHPIATRVMPIARLGQIVAHLQAAIAQDHRVFWVCPLVEDSEVVDATAAEERAAHLQEIFGDSFVGLIHGRMSSAEKDSVMAAFQAGKLKILVATTVIEVGVDVPEANIMVIEGAERFGLAQLHQLRGRVGRGARESSCILLYQGPLSGAAKARLTMMRETEDGFRIAEEDLKLRGAGEVLGTKQSGMPDFRLADLQAHADLMAIARDDATLILKKDPDLLEPRGQALRTLLYLFEREEAVRYLKAG